ncbi:MAG: hypothetical protein MI749_18500, partial [Desulfovibrionales bacterium]|nr:hypothetical protein [Desulfovibrionales bacterium]
LSSEQQQELQRFQTQKLRIRKELRDVQHGLDRDIEKLELRLKKTWEFDRVLTPAAPLIVLQDVASALDTKGRIQIQEKFAGKDELAKTLNQDKAFLNEFEKCRACNGILDLTRGLPLAQTATTNLLTQDTDWEDILSLAKRQKLIKNSTDDLATLVTIGQKELSYKHAYSPQ